MIQYVSNKGGGSPVDFETAILDGFACDGGLYVPTRLPAITNAQLSQWKNLSYVDLAFEILSLFIDRGCMSEVELRELLQTAYAPFEKEAIIPIHQLTSRKSLYVMELFHGPTISFKDIGLAFLVNLVDFFLKRRKEYRTLVVATTGDTGPATAYFTAGKSNLSAWILYPKGMITEAQERQMTTLPHSNIHPVGVSNCPDGGDDLDLVIAKLYANKPFKDNVQLSSVNSINWGRILMQSVHYFYGYLKTVDTVGEQLDMAVPSGGFGNLCAGGFARKMGLPVHTFVIANNTNASLHRIFSKGVFSKKTIFETPSSAIDILIPYNFWRYLYFCVAGDASKIKKWSDTFLSKGSVRFDATTYKEYTKGFRSASISDATTLQLIQEIYASDDYLLDPHGAVALAAADAVKEAAGTRKMICLATAHPAKFPDVVARALQTDIVPEQGKHHSIEKAKKRCEKVYLCDHANLEEALLDIMNTDWDITHTSND